MNATPGDDHDPLPFALLVAFALALMFANFAKAGLFL